MKTSKILFVFALTLLSFTSVSAHGNPTTSTREEITNILNTSLSEYDLDTETNVSITFMLNENNVLVVLDTSDEKLDYLIRRILNYQLVESKDLERGEKYVLPLSITML